MADIDPDKLKRDAKDNILRSELLRINKPALRKLDERQRRTIVRWLRGKEYWNTWANDMLARRKKLEDKGDWQASKDFDDKKHIVDKGKNKNTIKWLEEAEADFSNLVLRRLDWAGGHEEGDQTTSGEKVVILVDKLDFSTFVFPGYAAFHEATFFGNVDFWGATFSSDAFFWEAIFFGDADFRDMIFSGDAYFRLAIFSGYANFEGTTFSGNTDFITATFSGEASFEGATFSDSAIFMLATFSGEASFEDATFSGNADFQDATFSGNATFREATFSGNATFRDATFSGHAGFQDATFSGNAIFRLASFKRPASFMKARFKKDTNFSAIYSEKSFGLRDARFRVVPDFSEAAFHAPPVLDEVEIEEQLTGRKGWFRALPDVSRKKALDVSRRFRVLGKMAHEARDWLNEMEFFA